MLTGILLLGSCSKCRECSALAENYYISTESNEEIPGTRTPFALPPAKFCGSQLDELVTNDSVVIEGDVSPLNTKQVTVLRYTCL